MYYNKLLLCGRGWMQWMDDRRDDAPTPRSYSATKTSLQAPTLRVCAWTIVQPELQNFAKSVSDLATTKL
jgi:hypothetical protein